MRKNYLNVIVLTVVLFVVGCDKGSILFMNVEPDTTLLKIKRCLTYHTNPFIAVLAKKISFDYTQRIIVIEGLINIAGDEGGRVDWVVPKMNIKDDNLVISIPTDSDYVLQIGETRFYVPFIEK